MRKLVQAYSTLEAVPQMLWRPGPDHDPVYVRGGWIDSHIAKIQSAFLTAGQHMDRLQAEVSLLSRLKARFWVSRWFERPQGSPLEYENAQKRILEVFRQWQLPGNFKIDFFVIRVGEWGGHMLMECDDLVTCNGAHARAISASQLGASAKRLTLLR